MAIAGQWTDGAYTGHDFVDADLSRLCTERVVFTECDFSGANLAESQHRGSAFRNCTFRRTLLWHSTFAQCSMLGSVFEQCRMRPLTFDEWISHLPCLAATTSAAST